MIPPILAIALNAFAMGILAGLFTIFLRTFFAALVISFFITLYNFTKAQKEGKTWNFFSNWAGYFLMTMIACIALTILWVAIT